MRPDVAAAWVRALEYANCRCLETGVSAIPLSRDPLASWVCVEEYWNAPDAGHAIMASLVLDGIACEELP